MPIIYNSCLHCIAGKNEVIHCSDLMHEIFIEAKLEGKYFISKRNRNTICSISPLDVEKFYQIPPTKVSFEEIRAWTNAKSDLNNILINWLEYGNILQNGRNDKITKGQFRMSMRMDMTLMNRLYGDKDTLVLNRSYLPVLNFLINMQLVPPLAELLSMRVKYHFIMVKERGVK